MPDCDASKSRRRCREGGEDVKRGIEGPSAIVVALVLVAAPLALAAGGSIHARFDLSSTQGAPFPTNRFTVVDSTQNTGLQIDLPKPDCTTRLSDCLDIDVLN